MVRISRDDVKSADFVAEGPPRAEMQLTIRSGKLPRVRITDEAGLQSFKTISFPDVLAILDQSSVLEQLKVADVNPVTVPDELPQGVTLVSFVQKANTDHEYAIVSGTTPPIMRAILLEKEERRIVYDVDLGEVGWAASWYPATKTLRDMGVYLIRGRTAEGDRKLYRYPLSNVAGDGQGCWPSRDNDTYELREVPHAIERFIGHIPNNADIYGLSRSHNGPTEDYADFLEEIEAMEEVPDDWLIPMGLTEREVHKRFIERTAMHG